MEPEAIEEDIHVMAKGTAWQSATSVLFKLVSFVYTILIARLVAQEEIGLFYFALGIVGMAGIFADAGITSAIVRYVPYHIGRKDSKSAHMVIRIASFAAMPIALAASALLFLLARDISAFFGNPGLERLLVLLAAQVSILQAYNILSSLLMSFKKVAEASIALNVQNVSKLALTLALIFSLGASSESLAIAYMASFAISAAYLLFASRSALRFGGAKIPLSEWAPMLREIVPFGLTMVLVMSILNAVSYVDRIMLGYFLQGDANAQIAIYSISTALAGLVGIFASSVTGIFFPIVAGRIGEKDFGRVNSTSQTALKWVLFVSVPLAAFLMAFGGPLIRVLYGAEYESGTLVLALFTIGTFATWASTVQRTALAGMRLLKIEIFVVSVAAAANILLNVLLIPAYGINGAAFASAVALMAMAFLNQRFAKERLGIGFPLSAWKSILAGMLVAVALFLLQLFAYPSLAPAQFSFGGDPLVSSVLEKTAKLGFMSVFFAFGLLLYFLLLNLMRLFGKDDSAVLGKFLARLGLPPQARKLAMKAMFWNQRDLH